MEHPHHPPSLQPAKTKVISIDEASELEALGLLRPENIGIIQKNGLPRETVRRVTLLAEDLVGDRFHGPEVWAEDMRRQAALERAGWVFWRVFGSQWSAETERWWGDLTATLEAMKIAPLGRAAVPGGLVQLVTLDARNDLLGEPPSPREGSPTPSSRDNAEALSGAPTLSGAAARA